MKPTAKITSKYLLSKRMQKSWCMHNFIIYAYCICRRDKKKCILDFIASSGNKKCILLLSDISTNDIEKVREAWIILKSVGIPRISWNGSPHLPGHSGIDRCSSWLYTEPFSWNQLYVLCEEIYYVFDNT